MRSKSERRLAFRAFIALIIAFAAMAFQGCSTLRTHSTRSIASSQDGVWAPGPADNFRGAPLYFGFWGTGLSWVGSGDYIAPTAPYSNLALIDFDEETTKTWSRKLETARRLNQKVLLVIHNVIFPWSSTVAYPNYIERLNQMTAAVSPYQDVIIGFYLFDEPFWHNVIDQTKTTDQDLYNTLSRASDWIHQRTNRITAVLHAYVELRDNKPVLTTVDWIGFDCYLHDGGCPDNRTTMDYFITLMSRKAPNQKIFAVPDSVWSRGEPTEATAKNVLDRVRYWESIVNSSNQVIAVTPFLYQNVPSEESLKGAEHPAMAPVLQEYQTLGRKIVSQSGQGCVTKEPVCEGMDSVRRDSCGNELGRWANASACSQNVGAMKGFIDSVTLLPNRWVRVQGWACSEGFNSSVMIHVYAGGPAAGNKGGRFLLYDAANKASEEGVLRACGDLTPHRFMTDINPSLSADVAGKSVYVYAIDPAGKRNLELGSSGRFVMPRQ